MALSRTTSLAASSSFSLVWSIWLQKSDIPQFFPSAALMRGSAVEALFFQPRRKRRDFKAGERPIPRDTACRWINSAEEGGGGLSGDISLEWHLRTSAPDAGGG